MKTSNKKQFYIFLLIHFLIWSCIGLIRVILPTDTLEGIYWGSLLDFGTPKHPPLAAWITYSIYSLFKNDFSIYILSQVFVLIGFIFIYKLAKCFLDLNKARLSVIILEGCWIYSYITGYYGFNPDVVLLLTLPAITYYFYKSVTDNKILYWILFGIFTGISLMDKYQTGFLILGIIIWALIYKRDIFKNKSFYISILISILIFTPHILWLLKYDFFPMLYYKEKLTTICWYNHLISPLSFLFMQFVILAGVIISFCLYKLKYKPILKLPKIEDSKFAFLLILTFTPLIIHLLLALYTGSNMRPQWNYVFWYLSGIILFYIIRNNINKNDFKYFLQTSYIFMLIVFISFGTMLIVEKNYRSRYPVYNVFQDFKNIWNKECSTELKYIAGFHELTFPISIYGDTHPINIMNTFGYKNIWIDEKNLKNNGAFVFARHKNEIECFTRSSCPYLPADYVIKPKKYKFIVTNALNMPREYIMYYFIVPPKNKG